MCDHDWACAPYFVVNNSIQNPRICKKCGVEEAVEVTDIQDIYKREGVILEKNKKFYEGGALELFAKGGMKL